MTEAACTWHHYHQKIALSSKWEVRADFSLQLLLLINPATLSNVDQLLPFQTLKDVCIESLGSPQQHVRIYFTDTTPQFSCALHLHEAGSNVHSA